MLIDTAAEPDDLRASLTEQFDAAAGEPDTNPPVSDGDLPATSEQDAAATESLPETAAASTIKPDHPTDPKRYADGSFKPTKAAAATDAPAKPDDPSTDKTAKASTAAAQPAATAPPAGWTAAEKAEWTKLSPVAQAAVSRREAEISNGGKQWSEEKRRYEAMIAPVAESARARGIDAAQGIQMLVRAQQALDTDPVSAIKHIARSYGVDLATLAGSAPADGQRDVNPQQPNIEELVHKIVQPIVGPIHQRMQAEAQRIEQDKYDAVAAFEAAPGHEHFDSVHAEIIAMLPHVQAQNPRLNYEQALQEAYDRAVYANPTTRSAVQAAMQQDAEQKRLAETRARTTRARTAASSVTGSPSGSPSVAPPDSLRATIEQAFAGG